MTEFKTLGLNLPDKNRDLEALLVDPQTSDLWLISKWESRVRAYLIPFDGKNYGDIQLMGKLDVSMITGGSISPERTELLLKSYTDVFYWDNHENVSWREYLLSGKSVSLPYKPEKQGEAVAWKLDGAGYYTLSEGKPLLIFYPRKNAAIQGSK